MRDRITKNSEKRDNSGVVKEEHRCPGGASHESTWSLKSGTPKTE